MSDKNQRPSTSKGGVPGFDLGVSDLDPQAYLTVQKDRFDHRPNTLSHPATASYRAVPSISVSCKGSSASIDNSTTDPSPSSPQNETIPGTFSSASKWWNRRVGRAGRPRGSRAMRPRQGSFASQFTGKAKNLSYRGCLSDLFSHEGRMSRLQTLGKDVASTFQKLWESQLAAKQAQRRGSSLTQTYDPVSQPSGEAQVDATHKSQFLSSAISSNLSQESRKYFPICEPVSPKAGPSGLQSSSHLRSTSKHVSQKRSFDTLQYEPESKTPDIQRSHNITMTNVELSPEEVELYKKRSPEVIVIDDSDESPQKSEECESEHFFSDLQTISKYYAPEAMAANPSKVVANPQKVAINPTKVAINPTKVAINPTKVAINPTKVAINPTKVAINPTKVAINPTKVAINPTKVAINPKKLAINPTKVAANQPKVAANPPNVTANPPNPTAVSPQTMGINPRVVRVNATKVTTPPPIVSVYQSSEAGNLSTGLILDQPTVIVYSDDDPQPPKQEESSAAGELRKKIEAYRPKPTVPGTYIKLTGSHFYGNRNVELDSVPPYIPPVGIRGITQGMPTVGPPQSSRRNTQGKSPVGLPQSRRRITQGKSPVGPTRSSRGITQGLQNLTVSPKAIDDDDNERLLGSPSYDVPELHLFDQDGLTEALSYVRKTDDNNSKPQTSPNDTPEAIPGPSGLVPKKRGQKSSRRKSTVRLATPRPSRPSRARTSRSITGIRSTISDLTDLCGNVRTTTEQKTLPSGRKVFVGGGLPPFKIPSTSEVQQVAMEAMAVGHKIRTSHPSQEEEVLEDIVSWLMDNPAEDDFQNSNPNK